MLDNWMPYAIFVLIMTSTPGPGNLAHMAIGQTAGFRAALPFLAGTTASFATLNLLVALGLGGLFIASPEVAGVLRIAGMAYILYLAWKVLRMQLKSQEEIVSLARFRFWEGALVHPLSPKSWAMSVSAFSQFADPAADMVLQTAVFVGSFMVCQVTFHSLWCVAGAAMLRVLRRGPALMTANAVAVALMVGATGYALFV